MKNELRLLGGKILESKYEIAKKVHKTRLSEISDKQEQKISHLEEEIINIRADFVNLFGKALNRGINKEEAYKEIEDWAKETSKYANNLDISLDEALKDTGYYRVFIREILKDEIIKHNMSAKTAFDAAEIIDPLIDHAVYCFSLTYIHFYKKTLEASKAAFMEVSVPVVPLAKGIAVLPLIGNIDETRALYLREEAIAEAVRLKLSFIVIDVSGVLVVDTMVTDQLLKLISGLELLGVKAILTGIRPEIAQTIVNLGVNLNTLSVKANLQQALSDLHLFNK